MGLVRRTDTLTHWGIPGQKWGVRRWQYPDGRFTEEGKERYFGQNAEKEGYIKKNKDGSYSITDKGFKNTAKIVDELDAVGSRNSKYRSLFDKYGDFFSDNTAFTNKITYEYIDAAKKQIRNSNVMNKTMRDAQNYINKVRKNMVRNDQRASNIRFTYSLN